MGKAGRKRKVGVERYPSGQVKREEEAPPPALVKRASLMGLMGLADPVYGSILGIYFLRRIIDGYQYEAGKRFSDLRRQYEATVSGPKPPSSVDVAGASRNAPIDPESAAGEREAERHVDIMKRYHDAHTALRNVGNGVEDEVIRFCHGSGQTPNGHEGLLRVRAGLGSLVVLWKIKSSK